MSTPETDSPTDPATFDPIAALLALPHAHADPILCAAVARLRVCTPASVLVAIVETYSADRARLMAVAADALTKSPPIILAGDATDTFRLTRELATARKIIDGRTTPPSDAEMAAHAATGGAWLVCPSPRQGEHTRGTGHVRVTISTADSWRRHGYARIWWPLDADGRPCAWPEVQP